MCELRNDAEENLLAAILIAGQYNVPEVCLFFNNKLMRGNRTTKMSSDKIEAFDSPNLPSLAIFEVSIKINFDLVQRFTLEGKLKVQTEMEEQINILHISPCIDLDVIRMLF